MRLFKSAPPVEIPGVVHLAGRIVLPPSTYVFKVLDSQPDRDIVQIFDKGRTVITFSERLAGQPEALRAWFYPGSKTGEEFVSPKDKAVQLTQSSSAPVLFSTSDISIEVAEPIDSADAPMAAAIEQAPVVAVQPARLTPPATLPKTALSAALPMNVTRTGIQQKS